MDLKDFYRNSGLLVKVNDICYDAIIDRTDDPYTHKEHEKSLKYIGFVGRLHVGSRGDVVGVVHFANGTDWYVSHYDVEPTEEYMTPVDQLPKKEDDNEGYRVLTQDEKDFADKVLLQMIAAGAKTSDYEALWNTSICCSMERTKAFNLLWYQEKD